MVAVSELKNKLKAVSADIVKLEIESIFLLENGSSQRIRDDLQAWKLRKEDFAKEFYDNLVSLFSDCYEALDSLQRFVRLDMDARFDALSTILANPVNVIENDDVSPEPREVVDRIDESVVKKKVFVDTIVKSKALMGEIKQELERSTKTTVVDFLQVTEYMRYFPYEWMSMNELRLRTVETAILVSKLMVHFISYLSLQEDLFKLLKSKIESIKNIPTMKCVIAEKFVGLIEIAGDTISQMKLKETMFESTEEEQELYNQTITHFYNAVIDLEWIMSFVNVPEKRGLVNGARIRLEGVVGFVLYSMQGVRMKIRKQHRDYWMKMKDVICELWMDMEILPRKFQERGEERGGEGGRRGKGEAGTSGVKQGGEKSKEEEEEEEEGSVRIRRSRLLKIDGEEEEDAAESSRKQGEEAGDSFVEKDEEGADSSRKQVEEAGDCSIKKDEEEDVDSSGKQIEEVGDNFINNDEEEDVDSSGKQNAEAGDNPINNEEEVDSSRKQFEEAGDSFSKKDEEEEEADSYGTQVEELGHSSINIDGGEEKADSLRMQLEQTGESSVNIEKIRESSIYIKETGESFIYIEETEESFVNIEEVGESSVYIEEAGEFSIYLEESGESFINIEKTGKSSVYIKETEESSVNIEEIRESSVNIKETGDSSVNINKEEDGDSSRKQAEEVGDHYVKEDEEDDADSSRKQVEEEWDSSVWQFGDESGESWRKQEEIDPLVPQQAGTSVNHEFTLKEDTLKESNPASSDNDELHFSMVSPPQPPVRVRAILRVSDAMDNRDYSKSSLASSNDELMRPSSA